MGQKTDPRGFRLGIIRTWDSRWFPTKIGDYPDWLQEDLKIEEFIRSRLHRAAIARVGVERWDADHLKIYIHTARPGIVIGRRGAEVEQLTADLEKVLGKPARIEIVEIRRPELEAQLVAEGIAHQLERRTPYRQAMKRAIQATMRAGAEGCKVIVSGRLGGHEIAQSVSDLEGRVPLHTLRADIDYGFAEAYTTYGVIGVKVYIFRGEVISGIVGQDAEVLRSQAGRRSVGGRRVAEEEEGPRRGGRGRSRRGGRPARRGPE
ncbi:MAG: 30S ribosomal protein S3 [Candidatus Poribacteria bacterium]|nr:MAG: 30S ribosomal protein S3 [Candidatus Poribacteria bacterium]